ncbi:MAG: FecR family protein [Colwellia sp.]|nr:FecR family protein [Colwellia sp.]
MNQTSSQDKNTFDQAIDWCMRLHQSDISEAEEKEFDHWFASNEQNAQAYEKALKVWRLSAQLTPTFSEAPQCSDNTVELSSVKKSIPKYPHSKWHLFARVACFALFVIPLFGYMGWQLNLIPNSYHIYSTEHAKQEFTLPDGSQIELNLNTQLTYANYRHSRQAKLNHGEVYFDIAHDKNHPFVVLAAPGKITVTGTRFNVWKHQDNVTVSVTQGSVIVENSYTQSNLRPGLQAKFNTISPQLSIKNIDTAQILAWRSGQLIIDDLSLKEAIPLINRYLTDTPLVLANESVAKLRIGGIYHTKEIHNLVSTLKEILPINLDKQQDGSILISKRQQAAF